MQILKDFFYLFYPKLCANCEKQLVFNEVVLCTFCRHDLPLTNFTDYKNNQIIDAFYGRIPIEKANSLLFYRKEGITKKIIHELKYKGNQEIGAFFGNWLGEILKENNQFYEVDFIIPVPLHPKKMRKRGYNQLTKFGERLSYYLEIPFVQNILIRISNSKTQTFKSRFERFSNSNTKFSLTDKIIFKGKHVLLIDDVITTGATLESCIKEIRKTKNVKVSILTMALTE